MLPEVQQGKKVLGTPLGHPAFVAEHFRSVPREQQVLLDRTPLVQNLQKAWLLLKHCASACFKYLMRAVCPDSTAGFAQSHDEALWQCLCLILRIDPTQPLGRIVVAECLSDEGACALEHNLYRVLHLHKVRLPSFLTLDNCRCGLPLDTCGHHREAGSADARKCCRWLAKLAVDTTLVCTFHANASARRGAAHTRVALTVVGGASRSSAPCGSRRGGGGMWSNVLKAS